jgi:putative DNA primase/helicase
MKPNPPPDSASAETHTSSTSALLSASQESAGGLAQNWDQFIRAENPTLLQPLWSYSQNDAGFAEAFIDEHIDRVRFCPELEKWFTFDGVLWHEAASSSITGCVLNQTRQALRAAQDIRNKTGDDIPLKRVLKCGNHANIKNAVAIASVDPRIHVPLSLIDRDPYLVGVANGTLDLRASALRTDVIDTMVTRTLGAGFDPEASCPQWEHFIERVTRGRDGLADFLQRSIGYSLTGLTSEHCFWFLHGCGKNGKSVFIETLQALSGEYGSRASERLLATSRHGGDARPDELATLPGIRLLFGSETQEGVKLNEKLVKDLTGGDTVRAQALYKVGFSFQPSCKLWMFGNHKPDIGGTDYGIWRRVLLIPFTAQISPEEQDKNLTTKLRTELSGILNWALRGLRRWEADGLNPPACVTDGTAEYREDQDTLGDFLEECIQREEVGKSVSKFDLFMAYKSWAEDNGIRYCMSNKQLSRKLKDRGFHEHPARHWADCRLHKTGATISFNRD